MKWIKGNLIYKAPFDGSWKDNSFLQPTPLILEDRIRVYGGLRDINGVGRVGFVDLDKSNPQKIVQISEKPVLDIGKEGMFDENGVVPTSILRKENKIFMYYAGYMLGKKVRMLIFTGLAVSFDNGETFTRYQEFPITDRTNGEELFRVIHTIFEDNGKYKVYYGAGNYFIQGEYKTLPVYDIRYMESDDAIHFNNAGITIVPIKDGCHRVGRPYVFKENNVYKMYYGYGTEKIPYRLAYTESKDGINWENKDINLELSKDGWDYHMMAYPAFIRVDKKGYLFYNGNNYGKDGFGYAELIEE